MSDSQKHNISIDLLIKANNSVSNIINDKDSIYWQETRSDGKNYIVSLIDNKIKDITNDEYNVKTRVHEYGGLSFGVKNGTVYFFDCDKQGIFSLKHNHAKIITKTPNTNFAELIFGVKLKKIIAIAQTEDENGNMKASIKAINSNNGLISELVTGADFYAYPRLNKKENKLSWIEWQHPNMPWDTTILKQADIDINGNISNITTIVDDGSSVMQPEYDNKGNLFYLSDKTGFWQLYKHRCNKEKDTLYKLPGEVGLPLWQLGMSCYNIEKDKAIVKYANKGDWNLAILSLKTKKYKTIANEYCNFISPVLTKNKAYFYGSKVNDLSRIVCLNLKTNKIKKITKTIDFNKDAISNPLKIKYPTTDNDNSYAWYYPALKLDKTTSKKPALIVKIHGGPTGQSYPDLNFKHQFWTSRGFSILDVNHRGSSGFGREYRNKLLGNWGVYDVDDCISAVKYLINKNIVDKDNIFITGGSAGGYTVLSALVKSNIFKAGCSYYGVANLESLYYCTHKFEKYYLISLVGELPKAQAIYDSRSPINNTDKINCPILFLQGGEDKVVPKTQTEEIIKSLKSSKNIKAKNPEYIYFPDEGHGFGNPDNISKAILSQLDFFQRMLKD